MRGKRSSSTTECVCASFTHPCNASEFNHLVSDPGISGVQRQIRGFLGRLAHEPHGPIPQFSRVRPEAGMTIILRKIRPSTSPGAAQVDVIGSLLCKVREQRVGGCSVQ